MSWESDPSWSSSTVTKGEWPNFPPAARANSKVGPFDLSQTSSWTHAIPVRSIHGTITLPNVLGDPRAVLLRVQPTQRRAAQLDKFFARRGGVVILHSATIADREPEKL